MKKDRQRAIDRADEWFSRYIRLKYSHDGICFCYTSGTGKPILQMECGHFISRSHHSVRWHEDNARPQCTYANKHRSGMHKEFRERLVIDLGKERVEALERISQQNANFATYEIREIADFYRKKFNKLTEEKGNPWKYQ